MARAAGGLSLNGQSSRRPLTQWPEQQKASHSMAGLSLNGQSSRRPLTQWPEQQEASHSMARAAEGLSLKGNGAAIASHEKYNGVTCYKAKVLQQKGPHHSKPLPVL